MEHKQKTAQKSAEKKEESTESKKTEEVSDQNMFCNSGRNHRERERAKTERMPEPSSDPLYPGYMHTQ